MFITTIVFSNDRIAELDNDNTYQLTYSNPSYFTASEASAKYTHYWSSCPKISAVCDAKGLTNLYSPVVAQEAAAEQAEPAKVEQAVVAAPAKAEAVKPAPTRKPAVKATTKKGA